MPGSRKGERRGNAKRRPDSPNKIMREALRRPAVNRPPSTERRIEVARVINRPSGKVEDMTPREVLLCNMHYYMQGAFDWQAYLMQLAGKPLTDETARDMATAEREAERFRALASEDAYKVAPFIHPRLAAVLANPGAGGNMHDIVRELLEDIDRRSREAKVIEHAPQPASADDDKP